jgi:enoyl-CoA hydratase
VRIAAVDPSVRGVVVTGEGSESFVSGGDLRELSELAKADGGLDEVLAMAEQMSIIEACDVPVIAAVQGDTHGGGCELLLLCDMVIIEEHASLAFRHAKMGLSPAWGGMTRLIERVGPLEASRLLLRWARRARPMSSSVASPF